jgi:Flp pilus assembly protein TadG
VRLAAIGRSDQGQALVEFALILPVLLLLILGLIDIARAVEQENTLAFAAREGTRYAIVHGAGASSSPLTICGVTTTTTNVSSTGSATITPSDMSGIAVGTVLWVDAANSEKVTVTDVTATTFTATFTKTHTTSPYWNISSPCTDSTITTVVQNQAIGVPNVSAQIGYPDGDNFRQSRVFVDATAPFVPLPSQYLLNGALSITLRGGSMLVIQR